MGMTGAGKSSLISSVLSWSGTIRRAVSRRQLYTVTDRLPIYEKNIWSDLKSGANLEDKENGTDMSVLHFAASKLPDAVSLLSASASAIVATAWNNANNKAIIRSQHQVIESTINSGSRLPTMNPSLTGFVLAVSTYSIAIVVYSQRRRGDRWQDQAILFALSTSTLLGLGLGYDLQTTILSIVSWAVIAALVLSSVSHEIVRRVGTNNVDPDDAEERLFEVKL
ncbi:hypothetical protein M436DRAFT_84240 [Aureobasidium namibiae CBS 147.97]|uniref:Uncharacterized protein n=1 Tax=Aureobasidium namibiae CBS 147.97 TaxID=1043004 RepID=A0A074WCK1_9PEZI